MQGDVFVNKREATDKSSLLEQLLKPEVASSDSEGESAPSSSSNTFLADESGTVVESLRRSTNTYLVDDAGVLKSVVRPGTTDIWSQSSSAEWQHIERPSSDRSSEQYHEPRMSRDRVRALLASTPAFTWRKSAAFVACSLLLGPVMVSCAGPQYARQSDGGRHPE